MTDTQPPVSEAIGLIGRLGRQLSCAGSWPVRSNLRAEYEDTLSALEAALTPSQDRGASDVTEKLIGRLRERYTADPVPSCRVCGRALRIQSTGGGHAT